MWTHRLLAGAALLLCLTFNARAQSRQDIAAQLIGTWHLISTTLTFPDGTMKADPQVGPQPAGYMMYTDTHHMCAIFLNPDRPKWQSPAMPTDQELRSTIDGFGAYCGTYEVNTEQSYVLHHVELDRIPNNIGQTRKRFFTLSGNRLTLRIDPAQLPAGIAGTTIVWERVENPATPAGDVSAQLVSAWRLVSTTQGLADGTSRPNPALGPNQIGYMIYAGTHRMCAIFMNPERPKWSSASSPTPQEAKSALDGMGAYCATWEVNAEQASVVHHVELDRLPNAIGTTRKRFFTLNGNRLVLRVDPAELSGNIVSTTIVWDRIAN
jgi:hypothetical protein